MKLAWSAFALPDRDAIVTYLEADNPTAAVLIDERIVLAARRLVGFPASGRVGRIAGTRTCYQWDALRRSLCHCRDDSANSSRASWRAGMARLSADELTDPLRRTAAQFP